MKMKEHSFACIHSTNFSLYHFDSRPNIYSITTRCSQVTFALTRELKNNYNVEGIDVRVLSVLFLSPLIFNNVC